MTFGEFNGSQAGGGVGTKRPPTLATPTTVVAIPVRDEVARIEQCLEALARQTTLQGTSLPDDAFEVFLLLNNCRDHTAAVARSIRSHLPFPLTIQECELSPQSAHAGGARRLAMDAAAARLLEAGSPQGYLLTTDADTCVSSDWVARHHAAFARGADAVAGYVIDDPAEYHRLPARLRWRGRLESRYTWLLTELESLLDPDPYDPWPRHAMAAGASLGVRLPWYIKVGGLPLQPLGEDRALLQRLCVNGARVRHCIQTRVVTSCRLEGRATGGMADTLRHRIADRKAYCDPSLQPVLLAVDRFSSRATLRNWHRRGRGHSTGQLCWASPLSLPVEAVESIVGLPNFEAVWAAVEANGPHRQHQLMTPEELPAQINFAKQVLRLLRAIRVKITTDPDETHRQDISGCARAIRTLPAHQADTIDAARTLEALEILASLQGSDRGPHHPSSDSPFALSNGRECIGRQASVPLEPSR
jgi:Glycosyl transferase family 2